MDFDSGHLHNVDNREESAMTYDNISHLGALASSGLLFVVLLGIANAVSLRFRK